MKNKPLEKIEKSIQDFTDYFIDRYFKNVTVDTYWVGRNIGEVIFVNDYFFSLNDIINFIKYEYTIKQMFDYYDYRLTYIKKDGLINIKNYKRLKKYYDTIQ